MYRPWICALLFCMLYVSGCEITSTPVPTNDRIPPLTGAWSIRMVHSGGIMRVSRSIQISSEGTYTVTDERTGSTKEGRLSGPELDRLTELVASIQYSRSSGPSGCADCFIYDIEISGAQKAFTARADDVSLADSGLGPLAMELRAIMDRELK